MWKGLPALPHPDCQAEPGKDEVAPVTWGWHTSLRSALPSSWRSFQSWVGQASTATIQSRAQGLWVPQGPCHLWLGAPPLRPVPLRGPGWMVQPQTLRESSPELPFISRQRQMLRFQTLLPSFFSFPVFIYLFIACAKDQNSFPL